MSEIKTNKMGSDDIKKVMLKMGIPMILSMVLQACYNIVDSMFVARISDTGDIKRAGELAVNALTLAFPVQMIIVALSIGTGVGANALLAKYLGQKDKTNVAKTAGNSIVLAFVIYILFLLFGFWGTDIYLKTQTNNAVILDMGNTYLKICCVGSFGIVFFSIYEKLLQSTGKTIFSTIAQVAGAITNIVLDPILIFGYFGLPQMGVKGAAYATIIGQIVSMVIAMVFHYTKNKEVESRLTYLKLNIKIVKEIYTVGLPAIIMQALMSFMTYGVNIIFKNVSTEAVTAYGIFYKIQQFVFFAAFGLRDAITPIVAFNYGMGSKSRVKEGIRYGIIYVEIIMLLGIAILEIFANPMAGWFNLSGETAKLCVYAMRIIAAGFLFAGANIALQGVFQAMGDGLASLVVSLLRLLIVVLPLAKVFTLVANASFAIWFAFPIAELVAFVVAIFLAIRMNKKRIEVME